MLMISLHVKGDYETAARLCPEVLRVNNLLWEQWVFAFAEEDQLKVSYLMDRKVFSQSYR
jgi:hypothetical protein